MAMPRAGNGEPSARRLRTLTDLAAGM
jgi:hypothetical protein